VTIIELEKGWQKSSRSNSQGGECVEVAKVVAERSA
jgi:hypothetical protein